MGRTTSISDEDAWKSLQNISPSTIITDGDLDGIASAAILLRAFPDAEIIFANPPGIRSGIFDNFINRSTIICDLPFHSEAGAVIDHHLTNKTSHPDVLDLWRPTMSAARIAHSIVSSKINLHDLSEFINWVDRLDGGGVTKEEFLSDHPVVVLGRSIDARDSPSAALWVVNAISRGLSIESILEEPEVNAIVQKRKEESKMIEEIINRTLRIENRLAIVRFDGSGIRTGGYRITAMVGDDCDACMIIHGNEDGDISGPLPPLGASFYTNSFLHHNGGLVDLTLLATAFDSDGGGHSNACGCRIKPLNSEGMLEDRSTTTLDIEMNIYHWLEIWNKNQLRT
jgi:hypothetical protein